MHASAPALELSVARSRWLSVYSWSLHAAALTGLVLLPYPWAWRALGVLVFLWWAIGARRRHPGMPKYLWLHPDGRCVYLSAAGALREGRLSPRSCQVPGLALLVVAASGGARHRVVIAEDALTPSARRRLRARLRRCR